MTDIAAPSLARRLAAFAYEGVLLFGVLFIADYLFSALTQQRNAMQGRAAGQAFLFIVLGVYFGWFWSHGGQTVAMKAWHLRVVDTLGRPLSQGRALARYVLSWLWFIPALASAHFAGLRTTGGIFGCLTAGVLAYVLIARLHPSRQFLHDLLCGTRLVSFDPMKK
ncbi:MAG: RDD family protein [Paucibacter sp.]|nr:RDD family protein [Roseateles sp.]